MSAGIASKVKGVGLTGVYLHKINEELLRQTAKDLKLVKEGEDEEPADALVVRMSQHFVDTTAKEMLGDCDNCHGKSPMALDACPFCGSVDDPEQKAKAPPVAVVAPKPDVPAAPTVPKASKPKTTTTEKKEAQIMSKGNKSGAAAKVTTAKAPTVSLVKDDTKPSSALVTERELNTKIRRVLDLKGQAAVSYWHVGIAIKDIFDSQAWKQRNGEDGKPKYRGFDPFVHHELQMTPQNAYKLMQTATNFTEEQVKALGTTKLGLLLEAPAADRPAILRDIEKGASKREVEQKVRKARKEKGHTKAGGKRRDGTKMPKGKARVKESITVANVIGRKTIKLFAKPAGYKLGAPLDGVKRAKKITDVPFGVHELENDVKQYITVQEAPSGELVIVIETKRVE